jgi:hypothetical protein
LPLRGRRSAEVASKQLGQLRSPSRKKDGLLKPDEFAFTWVVDFPLLEWDAEEKRYVSMHHPFTSPHDEDHAILAEEPGRVRAKAYDLVLNGSEIGGGSIRIHDSAMQSRIFSLLAITPEEAKAALWILSRSARVRHAAARRHRARRRSHRALLCERDLDPRGHRVSQDGRRGGPDVGRAVACRQKQLGNCICRFDKT